MSWKLVRTLVAQVAEGTAAPAAGAMVAVFANGKAAERRVELSIDALVFAGTVAASAVTFAIWRSFKGRISKVGSLTLSSGVLPVDQLIEAFDADKVWVTVESFTGGTAPTIATSVYIRKVA